MSILILSVLPFHLNTNITELICFLRSSGIDTFMLVENFSNFDKSVVLMISILPTMLRSLAFHQCNCLFSFSILLSKFAFFLLHWCYDKYIRRAQIVSLGHFMFIVFFFTSSITSQPHTFRCILIYFKTSCFVTQFKNENISLAELIITTKNVKSSTYCVHFISYFLIWNLN